ncbi:toll/interleukin-1 receptor domain-containing protein [Christiangramia echinicola]|uniref:toll/interleukin-1 receptor domain-containing protein n=1 Tax=Christiangramia echinicola TaxID=279359 RepID=UPI0004204CA6|nr:toll/interleukin-1 receptor domain-containing protein [Christiangramia echinicola]
MDRDTIFISHATPEDNSFTIWLASRLKSLGYKVWIDKEGLLGGETFWQEIDGIIRNRAVKFLLVYSNNICYNQEPGNLKSGIRDELELGKSIGRKNGLKDFIIPLKIDDSPYDLFVGANTLNHIHFADNWAEGLKILIQKLKKDNIPNQSNESTVISEWFENEYTSSKGIIPKEELYYSSWWSFEELPENIYINRYDNKNQAECIYSLNSSIPIGKISNVLTTFSDKLENIVISDSGEEFTVEPKESYTFNLAEVLLGTERNAFPTDRDIQNHFKKLLRRTFHLLMRKQGLYWYSMSGKNLSYYFPKDLLPKDQVYFKYPIKKGGKKRKKLLGKHKSLKWHYSISQIPILNPILGYSIKHHLIFTSDGHKPLDDNKTMHSNRRAKGKRFFNEEWRDLQLAFIQGLKNRKGQISIESGAAQKIVMKEYPEYYWAEFGYNEPTKELQVEDNDN